MLSGHSDNTFYINVFLKSVNHNVSVLRNGIFIGRFVDVEMRSFFLNRGATITGIAKNKSSECQREYHLKGFGWRSVLAML